MNEYGLLAFTLVIAGVSAALTQRCGTNDIWRSIPKAGYILPYLQLGIVLRKHEYLLYRNKALSIGIIMTLIYLVNILPSEKVFVSILDAEFAGNPITLVAWSTLSVLLTVVICEMLSPAFENSRIIKAVGENTLSVMIHHPLIMFIINSALYALSTVIDMRFEYEEFAHDICYVYPWRDGRIFLLYTVLGVAVPVMAKLGYDRIILDLDRRLNKDA